MKIMIVDDEQAIREALGRKLRREGYDVILSADGLEALQACRRQMPDAILLDWTMPVMSGIDFLRQLRQESNGTKPTVVFCTTENDVERIAEALKAGADEYMMKPFDGDILHSKFAEVGLV